MSSSVDYEQLQKSNHDLMTQNRMLQEKLAQVTTPSKLSSLLDATYSDLLHCDSDTTEIILVRHGQTEWNVLHKYQGQGNSELTHIGLSGAKKVGKKLYWMHKYDRKIDFVYASPLKRAKQTIENIMEQFINSNDKLEIQYDNRLKERNFGDLQGLTADFIQKNKPKIYQELRSNIKYKPPGNNSETLLDVTNRAIQFLAQIASKHHGKRILVVTHGGILQTIFNDILVKNCIADRAFHCKNCAINIIQREPKTGKWYLSLLGDDNYGQYQNDNNVGPNIHSDSTHLTSLALGFVAGLIVAYTALKCTR